MILQTSTTTIDISERSDRRRKQAAAAAAAARHAKGIDRGRPVMGYKEASYNGGGYI